MLHSQKTGVTKSGQLLHPSFQRVNDLVFLELLIFIDHLLIKYKHCHFLKHQTQTIIIDGSSSWLALAAWRVNHLFCRFLGAIIDPPAHARAPAGNMSANFKLTRHRVTHDSAGDICSHLGNSAFQFVQHRLHVETWLCSRGLMRVNSGQKTNLGVAN